jgi:O-antigen ligase
MSSVALRFGGVLDARPRAAALLVPFAALANLVVAVVLVQRGAGVAAALTVVPTILLLFGSLVVSNRMFLVLGGLVTGLTLPFLNRALPLPLGRPVFVADLLVVGALGAWLTSRLLGDSTRARLPGTPVLGLPLVLFSLTVISGMLRGHERYGASLFGQPSRLIVYAAIGLAVAQLEARRLYHALVAVFYGGTIWMLLNAVYYMATGQSQTDQSALTTGGTRILAQGVAEFIAGSLFLSLLNLELDQVARRRALHMAIAGLSLFEIVLAFGRTTFAALAVVLPILCILFKKIRGALVVMIPLLVPFLILTALLLPKATPQLKQTFVERITKSRANDPSYQWRVKARAAVWPQVKESPLIGVGFGRSTTFTVQQVDRYGFPVGQVDETIEQDPHNSYIWLLASGGILSLGAFFLILVTFGVDALARLRGTTDKYERTVIVWAIATVFVLLVNAASGPVFGDPIQLLAIWTLLVLPAVVPRRPPVARAKAFP